MFALAWIAMVGAAGGIEVDWAAPPQCPAGEEVQQRLEGALAEQGLQDATLHVKVVIEDGESGLALALTIDDGGGAVEHAVVSQACETIVDAIEIQTLMAAIEVAEAEPDPQPEPEPEPEPPPESEPEPPPEPDVASPPEPPEPDRPISLRATGWAELGLGRFRVPAIDVRWSAGAGLRVRAWTAELGFAHTLSRREFHPTLPGVAVEVRQWSILGRGCWSYRWRALEVPLCTGLEAGATSVIGVGIEQPRRSRGPWIAIAPRAGLTWVPVQRFALGVVAEGYGALQVSPATVEDQAPWFTPGRFGASGLVRAEVRLP